MSRPSDTWLPIAIVVILGLVIVMAFRQFRGQFHFGSQATEETQPTAIISEDHFSPAEDLEHLDLYRMEQARLTMDIAMYSFTDKQLAGEIVKLAKQGVVIRIYRDREQYDSEQRAATQRHDQSTTDMFKDVQNIQVRVKGNRRRDLMHMKAYLIDGNLLRDGSANWSVAGERVQDNNARFTNNQGETRFFVDAFEQMWARSDNQVVQ
jgi:phosphatidylserine/phosphatidylglycerophosphate/cardiolipin synthase-like enzyme